MYDQRKVNRVRKLSLQGYNNAAIGRICGMSASTVKRIINGDGKRAGERETENRGEDLRVFARSKPKKCKKCGRVVKLPCVACAAQKFRDEHPERNYVDPLPVLNQERIENETRLQWQYINDYDDHMNNRDEL